MKKISLLFLSSVLFISGCSLFGNREIPDSFDANYRIRVVDERTSTPIQNAKIRFDRVGDKEIITETDEEGVAYIDAKGTPIVDGRHVYLNAGGQVKVEKVGYFQVSDEDINARTQWRYGDPARLRVDKLVQLFNPLSYTCEGVESEGFLKSAAMIATWMRFDTENDHVELNQVCINEFKERDYVSISMDSNYVFNRNVLNEYDVAKRLFTSVFLNYIKSDAFVLPSKSGAYGVDFSVSTSINDFTEESRKLDKDLAIDFYIPEHAIVDLLDKNISRQSMIESSVVLINGDLVELSLQ